MNVINIILIQNILLILHTIIFALINVIINIVILETEDVNDIIR